MKREFFHVCSEGLDGNLIFRNSDGCGIIGALLWFYSTKSTCGRAENSAAVSQDKCVDFIRICKLLFFDKRGIFNR